MQSVEFLGIPGSGKSTLASNIVARAEHSTITLSSLNAAVGQGLAGSVGDRLLDRVVAKLPQRIIRKRAESLFLRSPAMLDSLAEFAQCHPKTVAAFFDAQARRSDYELSPGQVIRWFLHLSASYQFADEALDQATVLVLDEGFSQRAVTGFGYQFSGDDHADLRAYLTAIPRPTLLINVVASQDLARSRLDNLGRLGTSRLIGRESERDQFLSDAEACVSFVASYAVDEGWTVLEIDGSGEPEELADRILNEVENTCSPAE